MSFALGRRVLIEEKAGPLALRSGLTRRVVVIGARFLHGLRGLAHGIDDARLRAAPANVALQELRDFAGTRLGLLCNRPTCS